MFKNLMSKIKAVMYRMGLIEGVKKITDRKEVIASDEMYNHIAIWKSLYKGYHKDWHDIYDMSIGRGKQKRRMQTLGIPKVVAQEMANLVFNEKCSISIENEAYNKEIKNVLDSNAFYQKFQDYLEYMFALGGMVIKVYADDNGIKLSYVHADSFIPLANNGKQITEGIFVHESRKGDKYYTLLEFHTWENGVYTITNELYESSTKGELGVKVALSILYPNLEEVVSIANMKRSLFVYFKPNTANNVDMYTELGASIYANAMDTMKSLDIAFDSFQREFRLGKKRVIVPSAAIKTVVDPATGDMHRYFDADDEVYEAFNFDDGMNDVKDISLELRVEEHIGAINALLNILAMQTGFSAGAFTFDSEGLKTATEVVSENSKTYRTRSGHITLIEEGLKDLIEIIGEVATLYGLFTKPGDSIDITVNFDDSIAEDRDSNADYWIKLKNAGGASQLQLIMKVQKVTEEEAQDILKQINEEQSVGDDLLFGNEGA